MGAVCCAPPRDSEEAQSPQLKTVNKIPFPQPADKPEEPVPTSSSKEKPPAGTSKFPENDLLSALGADNIELYLKEDYEHVIDGSIRSESTKVTDTKIDPFDVNLRSWLSLSPKENDPNKENIHSYEHQFETPFTPDFFYLFSVQERITKFGKSDESLDLFEVIHEEATEDTILSLYQTKSKKILVIQPRAFYIARIVRRISAHDYREAIRSLDATELRSWPEYTEFMQTHENVGRILNGGIQFINNDGRYVIRSFTRVDPLTSAGAAVIKSASKKRFENMNRNLLNAQLEFLLRFRKERPQMLWFRGSEAKIDEIFEENIARIQKIAIKKSALNPEIRKLYEELMAEGSNKPTFKAELGNTAELLEQKKREEALKESAQPKEEGRKREVDRKDSDRKGQFDRKESSDRKDSIRKSSNDKRDFERKDSEPRKQGDYDSQYRELEKAKPEIGSSEVVSVPANEETASETIEAQPQIVLEAAKPLAKEDSLIGRMEHAVRAVSNEINNKYDNSAKETTAESELFVSKGGVREDDAELLKSKKSGEEVYVKREVSNSEVYTKDSPQRPETGKQQPTGQHSGSHPTNTHQAPKRGSKKKNSNQANQPK